MPRRTLGQLQVDGKGQGNMTVFKKRQKDDVRRHPKGHWWQVGTRVFVCCPKCGQVYALDHTISRDGFVTPSVECVTQGCKFHAQDEIKLEGWTA